MAWIYLAASEGSHMHCESEKEPSMPGIGSNDGNTDCKSSFETYKKSKLEQAEWKSRRGSSRQCGSYKSREHWQEVVDSICRSSDGISYQVDRLRGLGNSVCPQQVKKAFEILMGLNYEKKIILM
jgi:hypothetical protein